MVVVMYANIVAEELCQCVLDWCRYEYFGLGVEIVNRLQKSNMNEWLLCAYQIHNIDDMLDEDEPQQKNPQM